MAKRVGKYEMQEQIGSGAFATVRAAIDTETGTHWAIKIVEKGKLQKDHLVEQLKREIALMKQLKHENIVQLREVMQSHHFVYLAMELVSGGELFDKIVQARRFEEARARRYFQQLMLGVACCHQNGIAHRDLKPENILLDKNDVLKISDFGLSTWQPTSGEALLLTPCGTANYVAPEVLKETGYSGFCADIWSCGVILYVMLAGQRPFEDPNMNALFNKIERGEYTMDRRFSPGAADLISKILVVDPARRYTLQEIIQHPWFQEGLDHTKVDATFRVRVNQPSNEDLQYAIGAAGTSPAQSPATTPTQGDLLPPGSPRRAPGGLDAFDLAGKLTAGLLNVTSATSTGATTTVDHTQRRQIRRLLATSFADDVARAVQAVVGMPPTYTPPANPAVQTAEVKGFLSTPPNGLTTFTVVVMPTTAPHLRYLEIRKGRGDFFEFQRVCDKIVAALGAAVVSQDIAESN